MPHHIHMNFLSWLNRLKCRKGQRRLDVKFAKREQHVRRRKLFQVSGRCSSWYMAWRAAKTANASMLICKRLVACSVGNRLSCSSCTPSTQSMLVRIDERAVLSVAFSLRLCSSNCYQLFFVAFAQLCMFEIVRIYVYMYISVTCILVQGTGPRNQVEMQSPPVRSTVCHWP